MRILWTLAAGAPVFSKSSLEAILIFFVEEWERTDLAKGVCRQSESVKKRAEAARRLDKSSVAGQWECREFGGVIKMSDHDV